MGAKHTRTRKFRTWTSATVGSPVQASTDGYIQGFVTEDAAGALTVTIKTDASATPTTERFKLTKSNSSKINPVFCPVIKGHYYEITISNGTATAMYFLVTK